MRLHTRLTFLIVALILVTGSILALLVSYRVHNALEQELEKRAVVIAQMLAEHVTYDVIDGDIVAAHETLQDVVRRTEDVEFVYIHGFEGEVFAHSFEGGFPRALLHHEHEHDAPYTESLHLERYATEEGMGLLVEYPLIAGMKAHLHIGLDETYMREQVERARNEIFGVTFGVALGAVLIGVFLSRSIARPIERLSESLRAFGERRVERELDYDGGGREVADVIRAFNWMITERKRTEDALRESEERLRLVVENMPVMLDAFDADGNLIAWNHECERVTGYSADEIIGNPQAVELLYPDADYLQRTMAEWAERGNAFRDWELELTSKDGNTRTVSWTNISGQFPIPGWASWSIGVDVTERKRAERALRESEQNFRDLVENSPDGIAIVDEHGYHIYVNSRFAEITGYSINELRSMTGWDMTRPEDIDVFKQRMQKRAANEPHVRKYERFFVRKDGTQVLTEMSSTMTVWQGKNRPMAIIRDITERVQAEGELRQSEERYRTLFERANDAIHLSNENDEIVDANPRMCEMMGYSRKELLTMRIPDLQAPEVRGQAGSVVRDELARYGSTTFKSLNIHRDGTRIPVEITVSKATDPDGALYFSIIRDITERVQAEKALRESELRWRSIVRASPIGIGLVSDRVLLQVNDRLCEMLGCSSDELVGKKARVVYATDEEYERVGAEKYAQIRERGTGTVETYFKRKDGTIIDVLLSSTPLDPTDLTVGVTFTALDITERKQTAVERERLLAQIQDQAQQVQQIVDTVPEGMLLLNTDGQVMLANPTAVGDLTVLAGARVGDSLTHLGNHSLEKLLTSPPKGLWHEVMIDDPAPRHFEIIAKPVTTGLMAGGWVLVIRDVTQEREIQQRLQRQERLAVVGQLAGGIAHDFNNLLTTIMLYAQMPLGKGKLDLPPNAIRAFETILGESRRATELVQQILDFSRRSPIQIHSVDLDSFTEKVVRVLERTIPENIRLRVEVEPEERAALDEAGATFTVNADPTRIQQVLMNLVVNARDAMPEGGDLGIGLSRVNVIPGQAPPVAEMDAGTWVCLAVSDTGMGISPDVLLHLFEPFFTTKEPGKGTGLGLAQVYGIVTQHNGHIGVETKVGQGTTFRVYLPASRTSDDAAAEEISSTPEGKGEVILLVEDNEKLREGGQSLLESLGYQVLTAANGREALKVYKAEREGGIDLVLTDLVMPEMGGKQLIQELKKDSPDIKALAATGYVMWKDLEKLEEEGFLDVVHKPFDVDTLARVIRQALDVD